MSLIESLPQGDGTCDECGAEVDTISFQGHKYTPRKCTQCIGAANELALAEAHHQNTRAKPVENGVRARFACCTFDTYRADGNRREVDLCRLYADSFPPPDGAGLALCGGVGTGKTHLAVSVARCVAGAYVINTTELLDEIRSSFAEGAKPTKTFQTCMEAPLLVLDDVGQEKASTWVWERLYILINRRYEMMLPTIFTTNVQPEDWERKWGKAVASRIYGMCSILQLQGVDWRKRKK